MNWTALIPIKPAGQRKTRLSALLSVAERDDLAELLLARTLNAIRGEPRIARTVVLSPARRADPGATWLADQGSNLNASLSAADAELATRPLLILSPDLLIPDAGDIGALLDAASCAGVALAADRHHRGTNGIAMADERPATFCFGPDSQQRFGDQYPDAVVVHRPGLAHDCDTVDDLRFLGDLRGTRAAMLARAGGSNGVTCQAFNHRHAAPDCGAPSAGMVIRQPVGRDLSPVPLGRQGRTESVQQGR